MPLVPKHIKNLKPYKPGLNISDVQRKFNLDKVIKLASNENPLGVSPKVLNLLSKNLNELYRYPDSFGFELRSKLAKSYNLNINNVILGNGSEGIISSIMRTFLSSQDEIIATKNSFIGFKVLANASGVITNWVPMKNFHYDLDSMAKMINEYTKLIYLANPDNPTGTYFTKNEFDNFMNFVSKKTLVILDEAYFEYANNNLDFPDSMFYRYDNVITLRTFSKIYGLAGLRIGYGFAHSDLIDNLMKVKLPFEPSFLGQIAAIEALNDKDFFNRSIETNNRNKKIIEVNLKKHGYNYIKSVTNFITIVFTSADESLHFCEYMLKNGIILRNLKGFGLSECVRITIGSAEDTEIFLSILNTYSQ